jgi:hypothetical protein
MLHARSLPDQIDEAFDLPTGTGSLEISLYSGVGNPVSGLDGVLLDFRKLQVHQANMKTPYLYAQTFDDPFSATIEIYSSLNN